MIEDFAIGEVLDQAVGGDRQHIGMPVPRAFAFMLKEGKRSAGDLEMRPSLRSASQQACL